MAATSLLTFPPFTKPNPNCHRYVKVRSNVNVISRCSFNVPSQSQSQSQSQSKSLLLRRLDLARSFVGRRGGLDLDRLIVPFAASHEESKHSDFKVEDEKNELESKTNESEEAWKQTLESFKEEAKKMKEVSQEAYEVYSKKAMVILKETSETLKIQAEKARHEMTEAAKEINKEGKVYLDTAAKNSPDSVKDVVETFASTDELKEISAVRDFYVGIPYGAFLAVGGFLSFMLTGSISAIRFGVILGCALLALSVSSLRSWKSGESSELFLKAQAAIAAVIFIREWRFFYQKRLLSTSFMTLISGAILVFYVYRIIIDGKSKGPSSEQDSSGN